MVTAHHSCVSLLEDPAFIGCAHCYCPVRSGTFHFKILKHVAFFVVSSGRHVSNLFVVLRLLREKIKITSPLFLYPCSFLINCQNILVLGPSSDISYLHTTRDGVTTGGNTRYSLELLKEPKYENILYPLGTALPLYRTGISLLSRERFLYI